MTLDDALDALYAADPGAFVETRARLARELKGDGRPEAAKDVKSRRKPPLAIWAVNQLSRRHPEQVAGLLSAGQALRKAQRKALSGVKSAGLREAAEQRARAAAALTRQAERILAAHGAAPAAHLPAVHTALVAAAADEAVAEALRRGRLEDVPEPPSTFGDASILSLVPDVEEPRAAKTDTVEAPSENKPEDAKPTAPEAKAAKPKPAKPKPAKSEPAGPTAAERRTLKAAREKAREAAAASADQAGQVREAEAALREAERDARDAERRARKAQRAADQARRRLERARSDAERLEAASRRAARELSALEDEAR